MARGKTLGECLTGLRVAMRLSLHPAHQDQVYDTQVAQLQYTQEQLWEEYAWPHLRVERYLQIQAGQRFYDPAGCKKIDQTTGLLTEAGDVRVDNISALFVRDGATWTPALCAGIDVAQHRVYDSDAGERAWPPQRWQVVGNDIELWPVPDQDGDEDTLDNMLKFVGVRDLAPFAEEDDVADLDDQLIILFTAARMLKDDDAKTAYDAGVRRMVHLRGNATKRRRVRLFGRSDDRPQRRGPPTVYYRTDT